MKNRSRAATGRRRGAGVRPAARGRPAAPRPLADAGHGTGTGRGSYAGSGVRRQEAGLDRLLTHIESTLQTRPSGPGSVKLPLRFLARDEAKIGPFANVIEVAGTGLAITTDGVGSKVLVAQLLDRYDTVGIDCVAMNVNDLLCVGAEPLALVDYIAVQVADRALLAELARGLAAGAAEASVTIPGGEIAQLPEVITGVRRGRGFDLAASAVGVVPLDRILVGQGIERDDVVLGLAASGIHSNGLTLARRLLERHRPSARLADLGRSLGEELLTPTRIYVRPVLEILRAGVDVKALIHITGEGFLNLLRVQAEVGFTLHWLPEPPAIFRLIQRELRVAPAEMYRVFNMGVGFCLVVSRRGDDAARAREIAARHGVESWELGRAVSGRRQVVLEPLNLIGAQGRFRRV